MSEGLFLGEEDRFFCQLQGAELRLRGGRDWPNVRKNNNIAAIYKNSCMRYVHTSFYLLFLQSYQLGIMILILNGGTRDTDKLNIKISQQVNARVGFKPRSEAWAV